MPEDKETVNRIYEFLLRQNYLIKGLTFSIYEDDIVLSLIIYDRHLNNDTAVELLQNLLERADYYDNVLVEELGAIWK
jgi:serine protease Do